MRAGLKERQAALQRLNWSWLDLPDSFPTRRPAEASQAAEPVRWAVPGVWDEEPKPAPVVLSVGELVAQIDALVRQLADVDPAILPPGQALGEAEALARIAHSLRHSQLRRTRDVSARHLYEHSGYRSATAWQRDTAPDTVAKDRTLARRLGDAPHLGGALAGREVSFDAAHRAAALLAKLAPHLDRHDGLIDGLPGEEVVTAVAWNVVDLVAKDRFGLEDDPAQDPEQAAFLADLTAQVKQLLADGGSQQTRVERSVVLLAQHLPPTSLKNALEEIELQLRPSLLERQEKDAQDMRALSLKPNDDGTWKVQGTLTPEVGEQLFTALAAEARRDPANPVDTHARAEARIAAAEAAGTDPVLADLDLPQWEARALREYRDERAISGFDTKVPALVPRSRSKRLHDAFARLLTRYLADGLGGTSSNVPVQLTATLSTRTIEGAPGAPPARGASGRPLARSVIRRLWCTANVTVLLMSAGWKPLGVVHNGRNLTATETKAARVQFDNRCPGIGCCPGEPDPLIPLIPHHVDMFSKTGTTCLSKNLMCCKVLHDDIHLRGKLIRLRDGSYITEDGFLHQSD